MARVLGMDAIRKEFKKETWVKRPHGKRYPKFKKKVEEYVEGEMRNEHGGIIDRAKTSLRQFTAIILMYLTLVRDFVTESIRRDYTERRRLLEQADADGDTQPRALGIHGHRIAAGEADGLGRGQPAGQRAGDGQQVNSYFKGKK